MKRHNRRLLSTGMLAARFGGVLLLAGCTAGTGGPTTQPSASSDPTVAALKDPMHYRPDMENTDISGGGLLDFDHKAFGKDLHNVLDP